MMIFNRFSTRSFLYTRNSSTVECSLLKLSSDIEYIYKEDSDLFSLSRYQLAVIQQKIVSGKYVLYPLQVQFIRKWDITQFLRDTRPDCPDFMILPNSDPNLITVVMPDQEDVFVLMGLSRMLDRVSKGGLPKEGYRLEKTAESVSYSLQQMGKVDRLVKLDLFASYRALPISVIMDKVKRLVGDEGVLKLISSFLSLPIIDDDGKNRRSDICKGGLPLAGEITRVLFNIVLMDMFDREFSTRYPGIAFYRLSHEVYIAARREVIFDEKAGYALLEELGLIGQIVSIGPGDEPLLCYNKRWIIYLDSDSKVQVCDPLEYY